jgi:acylphosphatase
VRSVRYADPTGRVHEPVVVHLPPLPTASPAGALVTAPDTRLTAWVRGTVQGVGFRWWTRARARELGLAGTATNLDDGRVEVVVEGPRAACEALLQALRGPGAPGRVSGVTERWSEPRGGLSGFAER